nr:transposase [Aspergillus niger CBS 513.88]|eukprot:XP_001390211.2 transposase [Aspergillus niger CBS 513.88]
MAPNLAQSTLDLIHDMLVSGELTTSQMARTANCSKRAIFRLRSNLRLFGTLKAPPIKGGRPRKLTPPMLETLCDHLIEKPGLYLHEMELFLLEESDIRVPKSTISDTLRQSGWSRKECRQQARELNADLRDDYMHLISEFQSFHLVYVDESGCDKRTGFRRSGWSPSGTTPVQVSRFHRDQRYQILPAYVQDGAILARVFRGSTDASFFEDFIEELLQHCGKWPEPKSVLVMDNASFHRSGKIEQLCCEKGVKFVYLPPYSPDLNPIEEFFAELKAFIRRNWQAYEDNTEQGFTAFLEWCVDKVGAKQQSAEGHFRHAGLTIEYPYETF